MKDHGDGNGGIIPIFAYDVNWLGDSSALIIEQGSDVPNSYDGGN